MSWLAFRTRGVASMMKMKDSIQMKYNSLVLVEIVDPAR